MRRYGIDFVQPVFLKPTPRPSPEGSRLIPTSVFRLPSSVFRLPFLLSDKSMNYE